MGIIQTVEAFFSNLWTTYLKPEVQTVEQVAQAFFTAAVNDVASQLGIQGLKIVTDAVTSAETAGGTGTQKLAAAQASITTDLKAAEISVPDHVINVAIEGAVSQLNSSTTGLTAQQAGTSTDDTAGTPVTTDTQTSTD